MIKRVLQLAALGLSTATFSAAFAAAPIDNSALEPVSYTHLTLPTNREV